MRIKKEFQFWPFACALYIRSMKFCMEYIKFKFNCQLFIAKKVLNMGLFVSKGRNKVFYLNSMQVFIF